MNIKSVITVALPILFALASWMYFSSTTSFSKSQEKRIGEITRDYLMQNPEILVESSQELKRKKDAGKEKAARLTIAMNAEKMLNEGSPELGNPDGTTIMFEFLDYQCGHCKQMKQTVADLVKDNPSLRVIFMPLPIFGEASTFAAKAAIAANKQGKFEEMHTALLSEKERLSEEVILDLAAKNGLNIEQLKKDMTLPKNDEAIKHAQILAQSMIIEGTPYFALTSNPVSSGEKIFIFPGAGSKDRLQDLINKIEEPE